jgi:hypothetical protein
MPNAHANASGLNLHEDKRVKNPARVASTVNVTLTAPGATIDGVTMVSGDRMLLKNQTLPAANGIYVWNGAASTATRATDATTAADFVYLFKIGVREGSVNAASYWTFTQTAALTIGTTALTFVQDATASGTFPGEVSATDFKPSGLTGATAASRYAGATTGQAPVSGTFAAGDVVADQLGAVWICTVAGSPGTFIQSGSVISGGANGQTLAILALTELLTIAAAATSVTTLSIPAGAIVLAVSVRVTVVIPTAATFTVIGNTTTTVFDTAAVSTAVNSTDRGTAAGAFYNASAQTVRITPNLTPGANTGRVRVTVFYFSSTPPTS